MTHHLINGDDRASGTDENGAASEEPHNGQHERDVAAPQHIVDDVRAAVGEARKEENEIVDQEERGPEEIVLLETLEEMRDVRRGLVGVGKV